MPTYVVITRPNGQQVIRLYRGEADLQEARRYARSVSEPYEAQDKEDAKRKAKS